ncbi:MAG: SurA N-terminal domain-containing protein [Boseongicola sp.]|nr:SurA N-terminal domain-containing protein [Boseongicola sp.]
MAKNKASNAFLWIIMLLLILGLGGFGLTNFGGSATTVAKVGDSEIVLEDYARALESQLRNYQRISGQALTIEQAQAIGLDQLALSQLVSERALENKVSEAGLSVGDENVSQQIVDTPAFQGLGGTFDRVNYEQALRQNGLTPAEYEERIRAGTTASILRTAVASGVQTPEAFIDVLFNFAREERDVTWARLTADDLEAPLGEPSDADLRAFYDENIDTFTQSETRVIDYALLTPDMIVDNIEVEESQLRELYDAAADTYNRPERRLVERLVFATEADAEAAKARIDAGDTTFADLLAERGLSLDDVDLGEVTESDLGDAATAVFGLSEPGVAGPAPSSLGPALFQMNAILAAQSTTFEEVRDELKAEAAADRARRIILDSRAQVEDLLAGGATPDVLAERTDMQFASIEWRADVTDGIAAYEDFRQAAATLQQGAFPEVTDLEDGGIAVLNLREVTPPQPIPFDEVSDEVVALWEEEQTGAALTEQADAAAERLRGGAEMAGLGLDLETDRGLGRSSFVEGTPPDFMDQVFDMDSGEIRVLSSTGEAWIVRLDTVTAPDPTTAEAQVLRGQFGAETSADLAQSLLAAFTQAVLNETEVDINPSAMNLINSAGR